MSTFTFQYDEDDRPGGPRRIRPMAQIEVQAADSFWVGFRVVVDAGAEMSMMRASASANLGITLEDGDFAIVQGVGGGAIDTYVHQVQMRIGTKEFECRVAFATTDTVPMILGRADVFMTFKVCFDDVKQLTEFHTRPQRRTRRRTK